MEKEIAKIFNKFSTVIGTLCTMLTSTFGIEWVLFAGYLLLNIIDYLTGTIKAKLKRVENSNKGLIGVIKKVCYWFLIGLSFFIPYLLMLLGNKININLDFIMLFGWFTLACLIINESRSIIENLVEIGIKVPEFLKIGLEQYQQIIDSAINKLNDKNK